MRLQGMHLAYSSKGFYYWHWNECSLSVYKSNRHLEILMQTAISLISSQRYIHHYIDLKTPTTLFCTGANVHKDIFNNTTLYWDVSQKDIFFDSIFYFVFFSELINLKLKLKVASRKCS